MLKNFSQFEELKEKLEKAIQFLEKGKFKEGEKLMEDILEKFPEFLPARLEYADFLLRMEAPFEALDVLREGLRFAFDDLNLRYLLGVAKQKCWFLNLAEREFERLKKQNPNNPEIIRQIGWTKVLKGEVEEGRKFLREAINLDLMNPWSYLDLGASFAMGLDFKEAFHWMETAKNLKPENPIILEKIDWTKNMERDFEKFSEKEKKIIREMRNNPEELKLMAIENLLLILKENPVTKEDFEEMKEELKLAGFDPKMMTSGAPKTKEEKTNVEYMEYHWKVPEIERKISQKEFEEIKKKLLDFKTEKEELKKLLLILAHQGTKETIKLLEEFSKKSPKELKDWVKLALEECKIFSKAKPGQVVRIFH